MLFHLLTSVKYTSGSRCVLAKQIFIPDSANAKDVEFRAIVGTAVFPSRKVRVISKPSKKKQSIRYNELSFESGCCVGLFNRVRSQTLGYISGTENGFEASIVKWSVLHLYLLDEELEYAVGGFVNYGNIVQITDQTSGFALPPLRIHRCEQSGKFYHNRRLLLLQWY